MSISWRRIRDTEQAARQHVADLEHQLIADAADAVKAAAKDGSPGWWRLNQLRQRARNRVRKFVSGAISTARAAVSSAARTGKEQAETDLRKRHLTVVETHSDIPVAEKAEREVEESIRATVPHAIRSGDRLYTEALSSIIAQPAQSEAHRLRVAQGVLDRLAEAGITGFRDKANRNWNLVSYVEMATKTVALNAAVDSHVATLSANGQDLVVVSSATDCCPKCAVFDGHVLSLTSSTTAPAIATLTDARSAGLFHPSCRCVLDTYLHGDPLPAVAEVDPQLYTDRQHLRYLERQVRAAKRMKAAAMDDLSAHAANARIRAYQKKIREHVSNSGARRIRRREQIGRAL